MIAAPWGQLAIAAGPASSGLGVLGYLTPIPSATHGTHTLSASITSTGPFLQAGGDLTASRATFFLQLGLRSAAAGNFPAALDR